MSYNNDNLPIQKYIDFKYFLSTLLHRWYLILSVTTVCAIVSIIYSCIIATPLYDSTAKIYIMNKTTTKIASADIAISTYLTKDYEELIIDRAVLGEVAEQLDNKYSYSFLKSAVTLQNPEDTRFINITVRTSDPAVSKQIVDKICLVAQNKIVNLIGVDQVTIISEGDLASTPATPNNKDNLIKSILIGIIISCGIIFVIYILDDKINGPEDVKKYLDISVLGVIPYNSNRAKEN